MGLDLTLKDVAMKGTSSDLIGGDPARGHFVSGEQIDALIAKEAAWLLGSTFPNSQSSRGHTFGS